MKPRAALIVAMVVVLAGCSAGRPPVITGLRLLPYRAEEHGKFVEISFLRALDESEKYDFQLELTTNSPRRPPDCRGIIANDSVAMAVHDAPAASVFKFNMFVYCSHGRGEPARYDWETIDKHVGPGMVRSAKLLIGKWERDKFVEMGRWQGPL